MTTPRHRWSETHRTVHETNRSCSRCGLIRVTRHERQARPWSEFWRDGLRVEADGRTPPCERVEVDA